MIPLSALGCQRNSPTCQAWLDQAFGPIRTLCLYLTDRIQWSREVRFAGVLVALAAFFPAVQGGIKCDYHIFRGNIHDTNHINGTNINATCDA